jgi:hypothetical protein
MLKEQNQGLLEDLNEYRADNRGNGMGNGGVHVPSTFSCQKDDGQTFFKNCFWINIAC